MGRVSPTGTKKAHGDRQNDRLLKTNKRPKKSRSISADLSFKETRTDTLHSTTDHVQASEPVSADLAAAG
jgi:hypothetical protein